MNMHADASGAGTILFQIFAMLQTSRRFTCTRDTLERYLITLTTINQGLRVVHIHKIPLIKDCQLGKSALHRV